MYCTIWSRILGVCFVNDFLHTMYVMVYQNIHPWFTSETFTVKAIWALSGKLSQQLKKLATFSDLCKTLCKRSYMYIYIHIYIYTYHPPARSWFAGHQRNLQWLSFWIHILCVWRFIERERENMYVYIYVYSVYIYIYYIQLCLNYVYIYI